MKSPIRVKYVRNHRHTLKTYFLKTPVHTQSLLKNNVVHLISLQKGYLTITQIVMLRLFIRKFLHRKVKINIPLLVNYNYTKKGLGVRMGKGKGKPSHWLIGVTQGSILFRLMTSKKHFYKLRTCLSFLCKKLPIYTRIKVYEKTIEETYCE